MDIRGKETFLSIPEAMYLERLTSNSDSAASDDVRTIVVNNLTAHALDILPRHIVRKATMPLRSFLGLHGDHNNPNAIIVEFNDEHLMEIKELATLEVHEAKERASNTEHELAQNDALGEILDDILPGFGETKVTLSEHDQEAFKSHLFEQELIAAQLGAHIIAVITKHQQQV